MIFPDKSSQDKFIRSSFFQTNIVFIHAIFMFDSIVNCSLLIRDLIFKHKPYPRSIQGNPWQSYCPKTRAAFKSIGSITPSFAPR